MTSTHNVASTLEELLVPIEDLKLYGRNPRREVLAGNHTLQAALKLKWSHVAVSWVDVDDEGAARIVAIDNRASDLAGYDEAALFELLDSLPGLEGTGFTAEDLSLLVDPEEPEGHTDPDDVPDLPTSAPRCKVGDVWLLGPHRLLVGDSTDAAAVLSMLGEERADCVWTDPPYGVSYVGKTAAKLTISNDGSTDLPKLLPAAFRTAVAACRPGAPMYIAHADTERIVFEQSLIEAGVLVRQNLIWVKASLVLGRSDYHYRHEPILEGEAPPDDDDAEDGIDVQTTHDPVLCGFTPGAKGRNGRGGPRWHGDNKQTTVFEVPKPARNADHPTMKPTELILRMLKNSLAPGGLVLDLFGGSGSTLIAAHHHRARAALVELDPRYADVICRRWQLHTGVQPIHQGTGDLVDFTVAA